MLPLPNVPVYYSMWRAWSHRSAAAGARALSAALDAAAAEQRAALAAALRALEAGGFELRPGEWPARLLAEVPPEGSSGGSSKDAADARPQAPAFVADGFLEEATHPAAHEGAGAGAAPLGAAAVEAVAQRYAQEHLMDAYRAALRRVEQGQQRQQQGQQQGQQRQQELKKA